MAHDCSPTDWMQGICSIILAVMSLVIASAVCALSWKANEFMAAAHALTTAAQQLAEASSTPFLLVHVIQERLRVSISVKNQGGGPAVVTAATYSLRNRTVHDTAASRAAHPNKFYGLMKVKDIAAPDEQNNVPLSDVLDLSDPCANWASKQLAGETIGPGCEAVLLSCRVQDTSAGADFLQHVKAALDGALIELTYTDARGSRCAAPAVASKVLQLSSGWSDRLGGVVSGGHGSNDTCSVQQGNAADKHVLGTSETASCSAGL